MRRLRVWWIALLVLAAVLATSAGLLHSGPARSLVLQAASSWLRRQGIEFRAGSLDYNLLTLTFWLKDFAVGASGSNTPFLRARSAMLRVRAWPLLQKKVVVLAAQIEAPRLELAVEGNGKTNLPAPAATQRPAAGGSDLPLVVEALDVSEGAFNYADAGRRISVSLPAWTVEVRGDAQNLTHRLRFLAVMPGVIRLAERLVPVDRLELVASAGRRAGEIQRARLESAGSFFELEGKITEFSAPFVDARVRAGVDVASTAALAGLSELEGALEIDATVKGRLDGLLAEAAVSGRKLRFRQFQDATLTAQLSFASGTRQLQVESLRLRSPLGSLVASVAMGLDPRAPGRLSALIERLDLERVAARLGLEVRPAAVLSGKVEARWVGSDLYAGGGSAAFELAPSVQQSRPGRLAAAGNLNLAWRDREIKVELQRAEAAGVQVEGAIGLFGQDLNGELKLRAASLARVAKELRVSKALPETVPDVEIDGSLEAALRLAGTLSRPEISLAAGAPALNVSGFEGIGLSLRGVYTPKHIKLEAVDLGWRGQTLRAGGTIGFDSPSPSLELEARIERASLGALAGGFGGPPVEGSLDLTVAARGTLESPELTLAASVSDLKAFEEDFGTLNVTARLDGKTVEIEPVVLAKPGPGEPGRLEGRATIGLAGKTFRFQSGGTLNLENLKLPGDWTVHAGVSLEAAGEGSFDNPALRLSLDAAGLKVRDLELGDLHLEGGVANHALRLEAGAASFGLAAVVESSTSPPYPASFSLTAQKTDLSKLAIAGLEGTVSFKAEGAGELNHPEQGRALLRVEDLEASFKELRLRSAAPFEILYRDEQVEITTARLLSGRSEITVGGALAAGAAEGASLKVQGRVDLADLVALTPGLEGLKAEGAFELRATVGGSLKAPEPQAQLVLEGASIKHPQLRAPLSDIDVEVTYWRGAVELRSFRANMGGGKIEAGGRLPLEALGFELPLKIPADGSPAVLKAAFRELRPQEIFELPEQVLGTVSLNVQARMERLTELNTLEADISFPRLELAGAGIELRQTEEARLAIREGKLQVERFQLAGAGSRIELLGSAVLVEPQALDLGIQGDLDAGLLALFVRGLRASGPASFAVAVAGSPAAPQLHGYLELSQGRLAMSSPQLGVDELDVRLDLSPGQAEITRFSGTLNGGALKGGGRVRMEGAAFKELRAEASLKGAYLEFPAGLRSRLDARLNLSTQDEFILVGGEVHILESSYRRNIDLAGGLDYFRSSAAPTLLEERNPWLSRVRFDVAVDTQGPLLIDNNLARLTLAADLRLVGTYYRPGLTGRASIEEGGSLFLNERTYLIERGIVSFNNESKIEPELDILATTEVRPYQISLQLSGTLADLKTELSSDPPLAEPDIVSVLVTGRPLSELEGAGLAVAREQAGALLSSQAAGLVSRGARETLRLSQVRIDPSFINPEANPGARLTIGQELSSRLQLVYSMNLVNGGEQIYIVRYDVTRRFQTEATRQSDDSYRFDLRHDLRFGGSRAGRSTALPQTRQCIGRISVTGATVFNPSRIVSKLGVEPGDIYNFFELQKGIDKVLRFYDEEGYPEAALRTVRSERDKLVDINVEVNAGPKVHFIYEGFDVPRSLARSVRRLWRQGQFDTQRSEDAVREIRAYMVRRGYLESEVRPEIKTPDSGEKRVIFQIQPGPRYRRVEVEFEGVNATRGQELRRLLEKSGQIDQLVLAPGGVADFLVSYSRRQGHLDARPGRIRRKLDATAGRAKFTIELNEGPVFRTAAVRFEGNRALDETVLRQAVLLRPSEPYRPELVQRSIEKLEELYWARGYNDVVILHSLERAQRPGEVALAFQITENRQEIVQSVEIEGNRAVSEKLIRSQLTLAEGDVLDYAKTSQSRRSLYQTGAFTLVDLAREPLEGPEPPWAAGRKRVNLRVRVREVDPFRLRYGFFFDTERGAGGIAEFTNRNSLGAARLLGLRARYDAEVREFRAYFSQPLLRSFPVQTNITGFARREIQTTFITDRVGFSAQQEARLGGKFILSYGYRLERTHTFDKDPESLFQLLPFRVAPLVATLTRETRDDVLDARRGSFLSQAFEWAPAALGSELHYLKYFGQYFRYVPLSRPAEFAFGEGARRPRWVYAGAVRMGLAGGLGGQELIRSERFFAGGGTTLRGFDQNTLGPVDFLGDPAGGNALFLLNQELRFPLFRILEGAGFLDIGNVYAGVRDFDLFNVRKSAGAGLRIRTPYFLLRLDYGRKLDRRPGEPGGKFFFSIGQAF